MVICSCAHNNTHKDVLCEHPAVSTYYVINTNQLQATNVYLLTYVCSADIFLGCGDPLVGGEDS